MFKKTRALFRYIKSMRILESQYGIAPNEDLLKVAPDMAKLCLFAKPETVAYMVASGLTLAQAKEAAK